MTKVTFTCCRCGAASGAKSLPAGWVTDDSYPSAVRFRCDACAANLAAAGVVDWRNHVEHEEAQP